MFCVVRLSFIALPGTEGMATYQEYGYYLWAAIKGLVLPFCSGW